jgi:hypothetical protein
VGTKFPDEARLASFFGVFYGLLGVGQLISSTSLAGPMLTRYGLSFGLMLLPFTNLTTVGLAALAGSLRSAAALFFFILVAAKLLDEVGRYTIEMPVYQILYQALPLSRRLRVQAVRESIVEPIGVGLCGAAAGKLRSPAALPLLMDALAVPPLRSSAMNALLAFGPAALPLVERSVGDHRMDRKVRIWMVRICGRLQLREGCRLLEEHLADPDSTLRAAVVQALASCPESLRPMDAGRVGILTGQEIKEAAAVLGALSDLGSDLRGDRFELVRRALSAELELRRDRTLRVLSLLYPRELINGARRNLRSGSSHGRATAIEVLDNVLPQDIKSAIWPLIDDIPDSDRLAQLNPRYPQTRLSAEARMEQIVADKSGLLSAWTRASAVFVALRDNSRNWDGLARIASGDPDALVRQTAEREERRSVLLTIEKVLILKTVGIFSEIPETALVDAAGFLEEVQVSAGDQIIRKGEAGTSLYIVVSGRVRVHDDDRLLATLGEGEVFGEMAVLDPEPRMASVSAVEAALLLRMDGSALEDLMTEYSEIAQGIIRMLCRRLRVAGAAAHDNRSR